MNILVTGSNGFLGRHLVSFLKKKRLSVITYDLADGEDLLDSAALAKKMGKADAVMHLAAVGDVYQAAADPANAAVAGVAGTANLVKIANEAGVKKIIYASTWEVYGEPRYLPLDEKHPCMPDHPYSIAKYAGELMIQSKLNKVPWIILRLGSAYGPHMRPHAVIPLFVGKALKKEPIILQGGGTQLRQFTHTDDVNMAFYRALKSKSVREVFNIVASEPVSIRTIAEMIGKKVPVEIRVGEKRLGDVPSATVSSTKAAKLLDWKAQVPFKKGLDGIIGELSSAH